MKAIIFDFDDTLGNRYVYAYDAYKEAVSLVDCDLDAFEKECVVQSCMVHDQHGDVNKNYVAKRIFEEFGIDLTPKGYACFNDWWKAESSKYVVLFDGVVEVLEALKQRGYKLAILTNGSSFSQHEKIRLTKIESYFDAIVVSKDTEFEKPDVEIFELVARKLGVSCKECLMVGDIFAKDMLGAYRCGMDVCWLANYGQYRVSEDVKVISHIRELLDFE